MSTERADGNSDCSSHRRSIISRPCAGTTRVRKGDLMSKRSLKSSNCDQLEPAGSPAELTADASSLAPVNESDVAELAYQRWVERGCPQGCPEDDWYEAERDLRSRIAS